MLNIPEEVKDLFKADGVRKNFRVKFLDRDLPDLTNENIVTESVAFTESMCSRNALKFGVCEASTLEFETVEVANIKGARISAGIEVDCTSLVDNKKLEDVIQTSDDVSFPYFYVPYGIFIIDSCQKQADSRHRAVVAYSMEYLVDYTLPKSLEVLKRYTWSTAQTLNISGQNLLDLVFPSYSYARKEITSGGYERWLGVYEYYSNGKKRIVQRLYQGVHIADATEFKKCLFTYKIKFDKNEWQRVMNEAQEFVYRTGGSKIRWDDDFGYPEGEAYVKSVGCPYSKFTWNSQGEVKTVEAAMNTQIYEDDIYIDNRPHTMLKLVSETSNQRTGVWINKLHDGRYSWDDDGNGEIALPWKVRIVDENYKEIVSFVTTNNIEYNKEALGTNGIVKLVTQTESRRVYNLDYQKWKINSSKIRNDYSFSKSLETAFGDNLREIVEGYIELLGKIGHFNRDGVFELIQLETKSGLYPSKSLYPSVELYPEETNVEILLNNRLKSVWFDDYAILPIRGASAEYKDLSNVESYAEYKCHQIEKASSVIDSTIAFPEYNPSSYEYYSTWNWEEGVYAPLSANNNIIVDSDNPMKGIEIRYKDSEGKYGVYAFSMVYGMERIIITEEDDPVLYANSDKIISIKIKFLLGDVTRIELLATWDEIITFEGDYATYDLTGNYFIKNGKFSEEDITNTLKLVADTVNGTQYTPMSVKCVGLPYIEAGDWISVITDKDGFDSIVLSRTLTGIQTLTDSYESKGE